MTVLSCLSSRNFQHLRSLVPSYICLRNITCFTREEYNRINPDVIVLGSDDWSNDKKLVEDGLPFSRKTLIWGNEDDRVLDVANIMEMGFSYFPFPNTREKFNSFMAIHSCLHDMENKQMFRDMGLQGISKAIIQLKKTIYQFAPSPAAVTILGETGTGKEVCARAVHKYSLRNGPFKPINCSAIPESLLEAELFGSNKGAYTDSRDRIGYIEAAQGGTLFLDEIGELSLRMQAKLLRVIEDKMVTRLGSTESQEIDVRIVCATASNLKEMVEEGNFRRDLFYRINILLIEAPALRNRKKDIPLICQHLLTMEKSNKMIDPDAMIKLLDYSWPGNIRELSSIIKRAVIFSESETRIKREHIQFL